MQRYQEKVLGPSWLDIDFARQRFMTAFTTDSRLPKCLPAAIIGCAACFGSFAAASTDHGAAADEGHGGHAGTSTESAANVNAIDLGDYRIRSYYPVQAQKSIVRFVLYATAPPDRLAESKQLVEQRRHKVRDQVITATRMVPLAEFDDPDLTRFRRRILLRLRRTIPELPLEELYISNFELQVQSL
jgi:hypothetical protein